MDAQHAGERLARERARIEHALGEITPPDTEDVMDPFDAGDVGAAMVDEELSEAQAEQFRNQLAAIDRAQRRLADGTYGVSVDSGEPIPEARLEAIPWAERTAAEQARYESSG